MSASFFWVSWKPAIGRPNCSRVTGVVDRGLEAVAGRAERAEHDAEPRLGQARQRPAQPAAPRAARRRAGQPNARQHQLAGDRGAQRQLVVDVARGEAGGAGRHDEAADALVGARPHDRDVGDRAVGDPHLGAVEHPVVAVALGRACACRRGSSRSPARSGRSSRSPRPAPSGAATRCFCSSLPKAWIANIASEPCTLTSERMPGVARLELEAGQAVRRGAGAGAAVALAGACRARRARRARGPARARGSRRSRTSRATSGRIRSSTKRPHGVAEQRAPRRSAGSRSRTARRASGGWSARSAPAGRTMRSRIVSNIQRRSQRRREVMTHGAVHRAAVVAGEASEPGRSVDSRPVRASEVRVPIARRPALTPSQRSGSGSQRGERWSTHGSGSARCPARGSRSASVRPARFVVPTPSPT